MPAANAPIFSANDLSSWYGKGTLTSQPWTGGGTSGLYGNLSAPPSVGQTATYNWQDIYVPQGTPAVAAKAATGTIPYTGYTGGALNVGDSYLDANGVSRTATAAYTPAVAAQAAVAAPYTSRSALNAYALAERAKQEAAAGKLENRERGNTILAGYDQSIANNRAISDQIMAMNAGYGQSMQQQLQNDYAARLGASNQSAIRRGLGNTTIRDSLNRGVTSAYDLARMQLGDQLTQRNIGLATDALGRENQGTAQRLGFLGSIQNDYPTSADYGNYLLQAGVLEETKGSRK